MKPERNQQIDQVFQAALACDPAERVRFLHGACADDRAMCREVEALLAADEQASEFIESPALEMAPELMPLIAARQSAAKPSVLIGSTSDSAPAAMGKVYLAYDVRLGRKVGTEAARPTLTRRH